MDFIAQCEIQKQATFCFMSGNEIFFVLKIKLILRVCCEGFNYDCVILNQTPKTEGHRNHLGNFEEEVNVGPRLHLIHPEPLEIEKV